MSTFYSLLNFMKVNGFEYSDPGSFDLITNLPLEITILIFRTLSGKDLLNAAAVSISWLAICKSDFKLRQKIRRYIRQQRRAEVTARLFGTDRRNGLRDDSNRPVMMNVANAGDTTVCRANRRVNHTAKPRYMPYRREATFGPTRAPTSRRSNVRSVGGSNSNRSRLRM